MNLLSNVDWRALAIQRPSPFESVTVPSLRILSTVAERGLVDIDVRGLLQSPHDVPRVDEVLEQGELYISAESEYWRSAVGPAPQVSLRSPTWLEAHPLRDGGWLVIPGVRTDKSTLSFWRYDRITNRPGVVSLVADATGRITSVRVHPSKQCQEDFMHTGVCVARPGGCQCVRSKSLEGSVVIETCSCARS
jgi:hypothetical protein